MNGAVADSNTSLPTACDTQSDIVPRRLHPDDLRRLSAMISSAVKAKSPEHTSEPKTLQPRPPRWPALMRAQTACAYCDVSPSTWKNYNNRRVIPAPHTIEGCVVWKKTELDLWMAWGFPGSSSV